MPELPDVVVYCEALDERITGNTLERIDLNNPFVLRTAVPPLAESFGTQVLGVRRQGKRIVLALTDELYLVLHLMIAGRLRWLAPAKNAPARIALAVFTFSTGRLAFTEAGTRRRASLHLVRGEADLAAMNPGGLEIDGSTRDAFAQRLTEENHTLKRVLTDPKVFSGIGNAYSDEILHRARLSPIALSKKLSEEEITRLHQAAQDVLAEWTTRLRIQAAGPFPEKVTAFRPEMGVHGRMV